MIITTASTYFVTGTVRRINGNQTWRIDIDPARTDGRWHVALRNDAGAVETFAVVSPSIGGACEAARAALKRRGFDA